MTPGHATDPKWFAEGITNIDLEIPIGTTKKQFRRDMRAVISGWASQALLGNANKYTKTQVRHYIGYYLEVVRLADETDEEINNTIDFVNRIETVMKGKFEGDIIPPRHPATSTMISGGHGNDGIGGVDNEESDPLFGAPNERNTCSLNNGLAQEWLDQYRHLLPQQYQGLSTRQTPNATIHPQQLPSVNFNTLDQTNPITYQSTMSDQPTQTRIRMWQNYRRDLSGIPVFDGDPLHFLTFKQAFDEEVGRNPELSPVKKLTELRSFLSAELADEFCSDVVADANGFNIAWTALQRRFGRSISIREAIAKRFANFTPITDKRDISSLSKLATLSKIAFTALTQSQHSLEYINETLKFRIAERLPPEIVSSMVEYFGLNHDQQPVLTIIWFVELKVQQIETELLYRPEASKQPSLQRQTTRRSYGSVAATTIDSRPTRACLFCQQSTHHSSVCTEGSLQQRTKQLWDERRCFKCLRIGHQRKSCRTRVSCTRCGGGHLPTLCNIADESHILDIKSENENKTIQIETGTVATTVSTSPNPHIPDSVMMTCYAFINSNRVRVFIDNGSQISIISRRTVTRLNLKPRRIANYQIGHFGSDGNVDRTSHMVDVTLSNSNSSHHFNLSLLVMDNCALSVRTLSKVERLEIEAKIGEQINNVVPDSAHEKTTEIDIILGMAAYRHLWTGGEKTIDAKVSMRPSIFGLIVFGQTEGPLYNVQINHISVFNMITDDITPELFVRRYRETIERLPDGRYQVQLPTLVDPITAESNEETARKRYGQLMKRAERENRTEQLISVFRELIDLKIIERCPSTKEYCVYLPYHYVIREASTTTSLRVVFDGSAGTPSLNDQLYKGCTNWDIVSTLTRFRLHPLCMIADITKAFLQISVAPQDRDFLRLMWNNEDYRFTRVPFGLSASPFLLFAVLQEHLSRYETEYPLVVESIKRSYYVDDFLISVNSECDIELLQGDIMKVMSSGKFELRKWRSNLEHLDKLWAGEASNEVNILGVNWNIRNDHLSVSHQPRDLTSVNITKRVLASVVASIYDPLGICTPVTVKLRAFVRGIWHKGYGWDEILNEDDAQQAIEVCKEFTHLNNVTITRYVGASTVLTVYCDASTIAYGCVAYLGNTYLTCKAHLTRNRTIPEAEWRAIMLGAELINYLRTVTRFDQVILLSDSTLNLHRLIKHPNQVTPTLGLQILRVKQLLTNVICGHVSSSDNKADPLSRGCTVNTLITSQWHLLTETPKYTIFDTIVDVPPGVFAVTTSRPAFQLPLHWPFRKLLRVAKRIVAFCGAASRCLHKLDIELYELYLLKIAQYQEFTRELAVLRGSADPWPLHSILPSPPTTILDNDGLIRIRSRLTQSTFLSTDESCPIVCGKELATTLIKHFHVETFHSGSGSILLKFRERFYTPRLRRLIKTILHHCRICRAVANYSPNVQLGDLPSLRMDSSVAFQNTGIDCFGPLNVTVHDHQKVYGILFTCLCTRAVHVEVIPTLTAEDTLVAFRSFVALRTRPTYILSDNGSNFRRFSKTLKHLTTYTDDRPDWKVRWVFICPASPWRGGAYERLVRTVKISFKRAVFKRRKFSLRELSVTFHEICQQINSRPLLEIDGQCLRPNCFLQSHHLPRIDVSATKLGDDSLAQCYNSSRRIVVAVWNHWRKLYLLEMRNSFHNRKSNPSTPNVDDLVLLKSTYDSSWPLVRILDVRPGSDGVNRTYKLKRADGTTMWRTIQHIIPLEGTW